MLYTRRRRGKFSAADRALRSAIGDAALIGWYDARFPWTIDAAAVASLADARGSSGYGPALAQGTAGAKPAYSASGQTITFDGSDDNLRVASATLDAISAAGAVVMVGTQSSTGGTVEAYINIGDSSRNNILRLSRATSDGAITVQADTDFVPGTTATGGSGTRVFHAWRTAASGGNITANLRVGSGSVSTATNTASDQTWHEITIGANQSASPGLCADIVVRAILVIKGSYPTASQNAVNEWARAAHGATI